MNNYCTHYIYINALIYYSQINSQYIFYINTINYCYTINKQLRSYCKAVISAVEEQRKKTTEQTRVVQRTNTARRQCSRNRLRDIMIIYLNIIIYVYNLSWIRWFFARETPCPRLKVLLRKSIPCQKKTRWFRKACARLPIIVMPRCHQETTQNLQSFCSIFTCG